MLLEALQRQTGMSFAQLERFAADAHKKYKTYPIKKRDGTDRMISQPSRALKAVQRWICKSGLSQLSVSVFATAYEKGSKIRQNAEAHASTGFTLRVDFRDFFPSFLSVHVQQFLHSETMSGTLQLSEADIAFATAILCKGDSLTIGAPSSPFLTNRMMFDFDERLGEFARERQMIFTRYADDIFISTNRPNTLDMAEKYVKALAADFRFASLELNEKKTFYLSRKYRRVVTGLVITPDGNVSLGRERKRKIRALCHQALSNESLTGYEMGQLSGLLSFAKDVEPTFFSSLERKYGRDQMRSLEAF